MSEVKDARAMCIQETTPPQLLQLCKHTSLGQRSQFATPNCPFQQVGILGRPPLNVAVAVYRIGTTRSWDPSFSTVLVNVCSATASLKPVVETWETWLASALALES
jgi:hypothetical protein